MTDAMPAPARQSPLRALAPHLVWEGVLLLVAAILLISLSVAEPDVLGRGTLWPQLAVLGFLATGFALSLRTGTPNLAVGQIAVLSGWWFAQQTADGASTTSAMLIAVLGAAAVGLVLALVTGLTAMPAWAVTLAGGVLVQGILLSNSDARGLPVPSAALRGDDFVIWVVAFVVLSVAGGVLMAIPAVRRVLGAFRPTGDDPRSEPGRWQAGKLLGALVGLVGSSTLAGIAGVLLVRRLAFAQGLDSGLLPIALAAVLLGGVSAYGRRGGIFGVVLGVLIVQIAQLWESLEGMTSATQLITVGALGLFGVLVMWLLELLGRVVDRPRAAPPSPAYAQPYGAPPPYGSPAAVQAPPVESPAPAGAPSPGAEPPGSQPLPTPPAWPPPNPPGSAPAQ